MSTKTKTPVKPLRAQILDFLAGRAEATLKQIAAATTERDFPSRVTTELNKMRTDALVECEKKKGKNELWYWLASPSSAVCDSQPAVEQNTGSSAEDASATPASGAAVQAHPAPDHAADVSAAAPVAADVKQQTAEIPPQIPPQIPPPQYDPRSVAFAASTDAEHDQQRAHLHLIGVLADIRAAVGDPEGRLMQDELVERVRAVAKAGAAANGDLVQIRNTLGQRIHIGDAGRLTPAVKCAEMAADIMDIMSATNQESKNLIAIASEKLADVVETGGTDTSDMDLHELAEHAAETIRRMRARGVELDNALHRQDELVRDLRADLANEKALVAKLEHLLQSARNEAEHLRRHADPSAAEAVTLNRALDTLREHIPDAACISLSSARPDISISAFDTTFDVPVQEAADALSHVRALTRYTQIPF